MSGKWQKLLTWKTDNFYRQTFSYVSFFCVCMCSIVEGCLFHLCTVCNHNFFLRKFHQSLKVIESSILLLVQPLTQGPAQHVLCFTFIHMAPKFTDTTPSVWPYFSWLSQRGPLTVSPSPTAESRHTDPLLSGAASRPTDLSSLFSLIPC